MATIIYEPERNRVKIVSTCGGVVRMATAAQLATGDFCVISKQEIDADPLRLLDIAAQVLDEREAGLNRWADDGGRAS